MTEMPKSQSGSNFAEWRCLEQHLARNYFHAKHIENLSVIPHMPSQMTPDKECLNTHSFLNLMGIWPSDSSSFVSANAQKLFRFFSSMAGKYLHKSEQEAALFRVICRSGRSAPWLTAQKTSCCCLQSSWGLHRDVSSTACAYSALIEAFWHFKRNWRKKDRTQHNQSMSSSHCPQAKIFWGWLLVEGSWEISKTFLARQGVISKQGLSEPRKLSNRARLVVTKLSLRVWEKAWTSNVSHERKS